MSLKKNIDLTVADQEVRVEVTWRIIEVVERVFGVVADLVASETLVSAPTRYQVAEVMCEWIRSTELRRNEIREAVMTCDPDDLNIYIGSIQAAVLFSLNYIEEDDFDRLTKGQDLEDSKKKSPSPDSASKSEPDPPNEAD